ncbi:hypothetical protein, partial [Anoxybacillus flavithermus]|uniref:hypothetical protein n=1 Tax=Anoxybacillus flavithermus TaxID=33934 RepID=UPI0019D6501E
MQKGLSPCMLISATKPQQEVRESYATVYHRWANIKRDRNGMFESRLCGRFFSRPIFLVIYGFIKSLYVSAFTYSHPVGMCVFS